MAEVSNFEQVIKHDRAARESKQWRGTLLEYLEVVKADPIDDQALARAHLRHDHLQGTRNIQDTDDPRTKRLVQG